MKTKLLLLITGFALALRLYQLSSNPVILNRDEASLAYNAFMLKEIGRDEWGRSWPLTLESFGDWKLPGYPILLVVFFNIFGSSDFVVRLPSVIAGTILTILSYYMAKTFKLKDRYALLFSLLVAISPVFFFYSHAAWEANVGLCYLIGMLLIILNRKKTWHDVLLFVIAVLAVFTYNTPFLLLPFVIAIIPLRTGFKNYYNWITPVLGLSTIFLLVGYIQFKISTQKSGITIFSDETVLMAYPAFREQFSGIFQAIIANKYIYWLTIIISNIIKSFSPKFLVTMGGTHPWHSQVNFAHFYYLTYLTALIAIIKIIFDRLISTKKKSSKKVSIGQKISAYLSDLSNKNYFYLFYFLIIGLAPATVTVDAPHATRSLLFFYFLLLLSTFGIQFLIEQILPKLFIPKNIAISIITLILIIEAGNYFYQFYTSYPTKQFSLNPGFDQIIQQLEKKYPDKNIAIVDTAGFHYILLAWYLKIPPQQYLDTNIRQQADKIGFKYGEKVTHYRFIAHHDDRSDDETILLEWIDKKWKIKEY
jgi:4-amino-4-deoxy-L-arabinose transferase-like glycosyltransferase